MDKLNNKDTVKILIVDDDTVNGVVLENYFQEYETTVELHAERVLDLMKNTFFQVVLMDINLSNENYSGIVLMKEARKKIPNYETSLFIAITGYAMAQDREALLNAGFDAYFSKPVSKEDIISKVKKMVKERIL